MAGSRGLIWRAIVLVSDSFSPSAERRHSRLRAVDAYYARIFLILSLKAEYQVTRLSTLIWCEILKFIRIPRPGSMRNIVHR